MFSQEQQQSFGFVGRPANLQARVERLLNWEEGFARAAVREYDRFMQLKIKSGDTTAEEMCVRRCCHQLSLWELHLAVWLSAHSLHWHPLSLDVCCCRSPSIQVDNCWHQHILHTVDYTRDCAAVTGGPLFNHNPDGDIDEQLRRQRSINTLTLYAAEFGHMPPVQLLPAGCWGADSVCQVQFWSYLDDLEGTEFHEYIPEWKNRRSRKPVLPPGTWVGTGSIGWGQPPNQRNAPRVVRGRGASSHQA